MSSTETEPGPRSGHLGVAWEAAVVSAFIVVIIGVIIVVIFQVRRRNRRRQQSAEEGCISARSGAGREWATVSESKLEVVDVESGRVVDVVETDENIQTDSEDEGADLGSQKKRSKRRPHKSRARSKATTTMKSKSTRRDSASSSDSPHPHSRSHSHSRTAAPEEYYFEHPSQKPPKYYWDQR